MNLKKKKEIEISHYQWSPDVSGFSLVFHLFILQVVFLLQEREKHGTVIEGFFLFVLYKSHCLYPINSKEELEPQKFF